MLQRLHYTPSPLASWLVSFSDKKLVSSVADFCVGDGSLIQAAVHRWGFLDIFFSDLNGQALEASRCKFPTSKSLHGDFLSTRFMSEFKNKIMRKFDLVVLNPPFCNVGNRRWSPMGYLQGIRCSQAMAFLLTAIEYVKEDGELLAILPASTLHSDMDVQARGVLHQICKFDVLSDPISGMFPKIGATVYAAKISKINFAASPVPTQAIEHSTSDALTRLEIARGSVSLNRKNRITTTDPFALIHTTSIKNGHIVEKYRLPVDLVLGSQACLKNSVIVPRVGRIRQGNIGHIQNECELVLSDCLFSVQCKTSCCAVALHRLLIENFSEFSRLYRGTGAPYITKMQLARFLVELAPDFISFN